MGLQTNEEGYLTKMWITDSDDWLNEYGPQEAPGANLIELDCTVEHVEMTLGDRVVGALDIYTIDSRSTTYQGEDPKGGSPLVLL